jgi:hypothetical protein
MTDNGDMVARCSKLLQRMKLGTGMKERLDEVIRDSEMSLVKRISTINFRAIYSMEHQDLIEALVEQFTLIEE